MSLSEMWTYLYMDKVLEHLYMVVITIIVASAVGVPLGVLAYFHPKLKKPILSIIDVIQTIPALAVLGIIMIFLGAGKATTIVGLTFYSLLPIVNNTYVGLNSISPAIIEAAKGIGMNKRQRLRKVMLPLAIPMIVAGIKIALVTCVGTAVFAFYVGGGGLGSILTKGIRVQQMSYIIKGMSAIIIMALVLDKLISIIENKIQSKYKVSE